MAYTYLHTYSSTLQLKNKRCRLKFHYKYKHNLVFWVAWSPPWKSKNEHHTTESQPALSACRKKHQIAKGNLPLLRK